MFNQYADFCEKQVNYINKCQTSWLNVAEGGKRGAKNVTNGLAFCIALENHPDKLFLIGGYDSTSARLNIIDCDGYGVLNYFEGRSREGKYKNRDCIYIKTADGKEKILLVVGGGKENSYKAIKGNTYGMAYITEANECCESFLKEVEDRTLSSNDRKIFHDLNPKAPNHWYYTKYLAFHEGQQEKISDYGYNYGHFNIFDNLSISDEKLKKVLSTYDKNSIWYRRDIKGNRIASAGVFFPEIANNKVRYLVDKCEISGIITTGVDFGKNGSAHAFCSQRISRDYQRVCVLRSDKEDCTPNSEEVQDNMGIGQVLAKLEQGFIKHIKYVIAKWGMISYIFCDSAEPELIEFLRKALYKNKLNISIVNSTKIAIPIRVHLWGILFMQDRISFVKGETEDIIKGFQDVVKDETQEDDVYLDDGTSDIDILDANDYGIEKWYAQLLRIGGN
jgi:PBSX family phage terminase large subunit